MKKRIIKITMPQVLRYYYNDGGYYDMPIGEITLANNPHDVQQTLGAIGFIGLVALIGYGLSK